MPNPVFDDIAETASSSDPSLHRVLIVGGGAAGLRLTRQRTAVEKVRMLRCSNSNAPDLVAGRHSLGTFDVLPQA